MPYGRSDLILQTKLERILSNKGFALVVLAEDKSKRTANYRRTSVIGYYPFNDECVPYFTKLEAYKTKYL